MYSELFNESLIKRYDTSVPRYTSYPTAPHFSALGEATYVDWIETSNDRPDARPLSLYIHIPFCSTVCYYCACTKIITANRKHAKPYLRRLLNEIGMISDRTDSARKVKQMHWGGGTPTFLDRSQMQSLIDSLRSGFSFDTDADSEFSIELDPREVTTGDIEFLRAQGFNRLSLGVQDINPAVQLAVNRIQPFDHTQEIFEAAREHGFNSISMDLIYGLPLQTPHSFETTLDEIIQTRPDRLSVFNYAHLPQRFKVQKQIKQQDLPSQAEKLDILRLTIERLCDAGYVYIGMDHFARPDDELAIAQVNGTLHRNFQGYSTHRDCDLIGLGVSSIGRINDNYAQNHSAIEDYHRAIDDNKLPVNRGLELNADDKLRRAVINELICNFRLDIGAIQNRYEIEFSSYFAHEIDRLAIMRDDGLVDMNESEIRVNQPGRLLVRNICSVFDLYLRTNNEKTGYSRAI